MALWEDCVKPSLKRKGSEMSDNNRGSDGIGICTVLFVVFLVLKLCGTINWSWWWITAPLWAPAALGILLLGIVIILVLIAK